MMTHKREITRVGCSKQNYQQLLPTHNTITDLEPTANDWPQNNLETENVFEFRSLDVFCHTMNSRNRFNTSSFDSLLFIHVLSMHPGREVRGLVEREARSRGSRGRAQVRIKE